MRLKLSILGVPHTQTAARFSKCLFTMKTRMLCRMMRRLGHEVVYLGVEGAEVECSEQVAVVPAVLWERTFSAPVSNPRPPCSPRFKKEDFETRSRGERREKRRARRFGWLAAMAVEARPRPSKTPGVPPNP